MGLVISERFLDTARGPQGTVRWETAQDHPDLIPGRLARLSIRGALGALDIYAAYLQSGETAEDRQARCTAIASLHSLLRPQNKVLSLAGGDWNWVPTKEDRWCRDTGQYTGHKDGREAGIWHSFFRAPGHEKLHELD